jgi:hypothetical protein
MISDNTKKVRKNRVYNIQASLLDFCYESGVKIFWSKTICSQK